MKTLSILILLGCLLVIAGYAADEGNSPQDQSLQVGAPEQMQLATTPVSTRPSTQVNAVTSASPALNN